MFFLIIILNRLFYEEFGIREEIFKLILTFLDILNESQFNSIVFLRENEFFSSLRASLIS